jgi:hypothetical protein
MYGEYTSSSELSEHVGHTLSTFSKKASKRGVEKDKQDGITSLLVERRMDGFISLLFKQK